MTNSKLALLGFGNVGQAFARLLLSKQAYLADAYQLTFSVTGIATGRHGVAIDPGGLDLHQALDLVARGASLESLSTVPPPKNSLEFIRSCEADVLFENTPVNYETGQPATEHLQLALEMGKHAVTANKGPVVHAYHVLTSLARERGRKFFFEAAVMDGAPIFALFRETLPAADLRSFRGVLNSTTTTTAVPTPSFTGSAAKAHGSSANWVTNHSPASTGRTATSPSNNCTCNTPS